MAPSLHAYYFGANAYTLVPAHIEADLVWMAEHGTRSFCLAVIEDQIATGKENLLHIARLAAKHGLEMDLVPSYVCGLLAGAPHVPCPFLAYRPDLWVCDLEGQPRRRSNGPLGTIHHPDVFAHLVETVDRMLDLAPFRRVIWDEPKCFVPNWHPDGSAAGRAANPTGDWQVQVTAGAEFFGRVNALLKAKHPEVEFWMFDEAFKDDTVVAAQAGIPHLDAYGCDGRPWRTADSRLSGLRARKSLIDEGPRFHRAATAHGLRSFALIENHMLAAADLPLLDARLGEVLAMPFDHLIYYYYPNGCEDPDRGMQIIGHHLKGLRP